MRRRQARLRAEHDPTRHRHCPQLEQRAGHPCLFGVIAPGELPLVLHRRRGQRLDRWLA